MYLHIYIILHYVYMTLYILYIMLYILLNKNLNFCPAPNK